MARIPKVLESADGNGDVGNSEGPVENRRAQLVRLLGDAERFVDLYFEALKAKKFGLARDYRKRAHQMARYAASKIGVLEIEFGFAMGPEVERAKKVFAAISPPTGVEARS